MRWHRLCCNAANTTISGRIVIRELHEPERRDVLAFFLALGEDDRYRRFGRAMADAGVRRYIETLDWDACVMLGAYDAGARLIGVLELAEVANAACEIAVVVAATQRGRGIGKALMDRALLKAKVHGCDSVVLLCQVDNAPMRRLALSAGLTSTTEDGDVEGSLDLPHAALVDVTEDVTREAIGNATYASLLATRTLAELFENALRATARPTHQPSG
jgi:GNAT superfamily N-acetyltransferase